MALLARLTWAEASTAIAWSRAAQAWLQLPAALVAQRQCAGAVKLGADVVVFEGESPGRAATRFLSVERLAPAGGEGLLGARLKELGAPCSGEHSR